MTDTLIAIAIVAAAAGLLGWMLYRRLGGKTRGCCTGTTSCSGCQQFTRPTGKSDHPERPKAKPGATDRDTTTSR